MTDASNNGQEADAAEAREPSRVTVGLELEMPVVTAATGATHLVGPFFRHLAALKAARGESAALKQAHGCDLSVHSAVADTGLDNAFNNLESAFLPVAAETAAQGLERLRVAVKAELADVTAALRAEGAALVNFSQHPDVTIDAAFYRRARAPKPIYDYWVAGRGWQHQVGVDAKAQNGPTTGVALDDAVRALNLVLRTAPVFIALFANSPFEAGRPSGQKETRLSIWPRMFAEARFPADRWLHRLPDTPFRDLRHYFAWMFGPGTAMHVVPECLTSDYKGSDHLVRVKGDPSFLDFLGRPRASGRRLATGETVTLEPALHHMAFLQFTPFLDARIRYRLTRPLPREEFMTVWASDAPLEPVFAAMAEGWYIEGRCPGANLPDRDLLERSGGDARLMQSMVMAPSALQAGLLAALTAAERWAAVRLPWHAVPALREAAIRDGLHGEAAGLRLRDLAAEMIAVAADALGREGAWMLDYPLHAVRHTETGADRAMRTWQACGEDMRALLTARQVVDLPDLPQDAPMPQAVGAV